MEDTSPSSPPPSALPAPPVSWVRVAAPLSCSGSEASEPPTASDLSLLTLLASDNAHAFAKALPPLPLGCNAPVSLLPLGRAARSWTWLHAAAAQGAAGCLQLLLMPGVLRSFHGVVDRRAGDGRAPLLIASEHRHSSSASGKDCEAVSCLLRAGATAHAPRKPDGVTPAHLCCRASCARCLRALLQKSPQLVDATCRAGETPLHAAARVGASECASTLLSLGACIDATTDGDGKLLTPLHLACRAGSRRLVALLLERQASVHTRDGLSRTPLRHATAAGATHAVAMLLEASADPDCFGVALKTGVRKVEEVMLLEMRRVLERCDAVDVVSSALAGERGGGQLCPAGVAKAVDQVVARWARVLTCLVRGGASVRVADLATLQLGYTECRAAATATAAAAAAGSPSKVLPPEPSVPSLLELSQRALAFGLSSETVLSTLHLAVMLGAPSRLRSECERLVLLNCRSLEDTGAFAAAGLAPRSFVRALLENGLRQSAAAAVERSTDATVSDDSARRVWYDFDLPAIWAEETDPFDPAWGGGGEDDETSSGSDSSESDE